MEQPLELLTRELVTVARIIRLEPPDVILINIEGNDNVISARSCVPLTSSDELSEVLVVLRNDEKQRPIIVGVIKEEPVRWGPMVFDGPSAVDKNIGGSRVNEAHYRALDKLVLECGEGSITINKKGHIIIKGTKVVSRSKGVNSIKGASVRIN
jgi:hypothetical protein